MYDVNDFKIGLIYKYTSPSGKVYIGKTTDEKSRKSKHKTNSVKLNTHFAKAIRKYGFENFKYEVLIKFKPTLDIKKLDRVLNKLEIRYIKLYNSQSPSCGYNLTLGGDGSYGYKHTEETKQKLKKDILNRPKEWHNKLSKSAKQRCSGELPDYIKENLELGRKTHSEETKKKISQSQKKNSKVVQKCDLEGNVLEEYDSIIDAARSFEDNHKTRAKRIGECCNGKRKTIYSFIWKYL